MRSRRLVSFAVLLVLLQLFAPARVLYACEFMGILPDDDCMHDGPRSDMPRDVDDCLEPIVEDGQTPVSANHANAPDGVWKSLPPIAIVVAVVLPVTMELPLPAQGPPDPLRDSLGHHRHTYLQTLRLRI